MRATDKIKEEILSTIRENLAASKRIEANLHKPHRHDLQVDPESQNKKIHSRGDILAEFQTNLEMVGGKCTVVQSIESTAAVLQTIVDSLDPQAIAISDSADVLAVVELISTDDVPILKNSSSHDLFRCTVGITSAQWGIAETGTLVLDSSTEFNRLTSLIPDVHVCLLRAQRIHQTMGEILEIL